MRRRRVFIDSSFVMVLLDPSDDRHGTARAAFERLLVEFERGVTLLYSHEAVVADVDDRRAGELLRVCDVAPMRRWLTRRAERIERDHLGLGRQRAATLFLMSQWRIGEIATFDPFFEQDGIPTLPVPMVGAV